MFVLLVGVVHGLPFHMKSHRRKNHRKFRNATHTLAEAIDVMFPTDAMFRFIIDHWEEADLSDEEPLASNMKDAAKSIGYGSHRSRGRSSNRVPGGHYSGSSYRSATHAYSYGSDSLGSDQYSGKFIIQSTESFRIQSLENYSKYAS